MGIPARACGYGTWPRLARSALCGAGGRITWPLCRRRPYIAHMQLGICGCACKCGLFLVACAAYSRDYACSMIFTPRVCSRACAAQRTSSFRTCVMCPRRKRPSSPPPPPPPPGPPFAARRPPYPSSERWSQTDSCECHNTNTKYTCGAAHVVGCVRAYVCLRASQLPPDGRACDPATSGRNSAPGREQPSTVKANRKKVLHTTIPYSSRSLAVATRVWSAKDSPTSRRIRLTV